MLRKASILAFLVAVLPACDDDGDPLPPLPPRDGGDVGPPWWTPEPGEASNWDIQLHAPFDLTQTRAMYMLDLFAVVPSPQTIEYDDGSITVPAGALPTAIADIHATSGIVVCRVGTGAIRLDDPDAMKFPGFEATPPDDPDLPAAGSVIGWNTSDPNEPNERYLDTREASRTVVLPFIEKRYQLAKDIGCDAIDAAQSLVIKPLETGFGDIEIDVQISWDLAVAERAHAKPRELSIGLHDGLFVSDDTSIIAAYDWTLMERLVENLVCCDELRPFINERKAAFAIDYVPTVTSNAACGQYDDANVDGLLKDEALSSTSREACP